MKLRLTILAGVLLVAFATTVEGQATQVATTDLRSIFFHRNYETAVAEGPKVIARAPDSVELKAWYALNLERSGEERRALALAEELTSKKPQNAWSWFALAGVLNYAHERPADAIAAAEKALNLLPDNADMIWIRAQTLANDGKRRDEAIAFVDAQRSRVRNPAELLVSKAYALYSQSAGTPRNEEKLKQAFATFEEARRIDPANVSAWYLPGSYLNNLRRSDDAYPLLVKAVQLSPDSMTVRGAYWDAITGSREKSAETKRQEIEADVNDLLKGHPDRPWVLYSVAIICEQMKWAERKRELDDRILKEFPDTLEADWTTVERWRALGQTKEAYTSPQYRQLLTDYIARPSHHISTELLGEAYRRLFAVVEYDKSASGDELYRVAQGALKYETNNPHSTWGYMPVVLAERKVHLSDAERIARDGIEVLRKKIESQRSASSGQGEYERTMGWYTGLGHDALGWVLFAEGKTVEAEKELLAAYELNHEDRRNLDHLGRFYLAQKDEAKAEEYFVRGLGVQGGGVNPSETSLRSLYEKRHGNVAGFDEYLAKLKDTESEKRRERILAERIAAREAVPAFDLKTLDGRRVTLDSLKGKIVVINFWGIWCGWCVQELPEYQKLYEKYANDPSVAILTIDNDENPDDVPPWVAQKKYTFPVLIDEHYVEKTGIQVMPTTWFLDAQGRKIFEKTGWSEKLLEEFGWRIEAIRAGTKTGT